MKSAIFSLAGLIFPLAVHAEPLEKTTAIVRATGGVLQSVVLVVFSLALVVFAWGIVKYLTAAGDAAKLKVARPFLWWGIIGLFVLAAVWGLIVFIAKELNIQEGPETEGKIMPLKVE